MSDAVILEHSVVQLIVRVRAPCEVREVAFEVPRKFQYLKREFLDPDDVELQCCITMTQCRKFGTEVEVDQSAAARHELARVWLRSLVATVQRQSIVC